MRWTHNAEMKGIAPEMSIYIYISMYIYIYIYPVHPMLAVSPFMALDYGSRLIKNWVPATLLHRRSPSTYMTGHIAMYARAPSSQKTKAPMKSE